MTVSAQPPPPPPPPPPPVLDPAFVTDATDEAYLPHRAFAFGAQLFKDRIYVSDMSSGLWVLELTGEPRAQYPAE